MRQIQVFGITAPLAVAISVSAATAQPQPDYYLSKDFSGDPVGLNSSRGAEIVPAKYSRIKYCGNGISLMTGIDPHHKYQCGSDVHIFNQKGRELKYTIPEGTILLDVFSLGEQADTHVKSMVKNLPAGTILKFVKEQETGLCDGQGKVILPLQKGTICFLKPGTGYIAEDTPYLGIKNKQNKIVDLATGKVSPDTASLMPHSFTTRITVSGETNSEKMEPLPNLKHARFSPIAPGVFEKTALQDNGKFNREYWKNHRAYPVTRLEMFDRFLHEHNLIGMKVDRVLDFLGSGGVGIFSGSGIEPIGYKGDLQRLTLNIARGGCTPDSTTRVAINFEHGKVDSWRFALGNTEWPLVTSNVVLAIPHPGRLINGRIGELPSSTPLDLRPK